MNELPPGAAAQGLSSAIAHELNNVLGVVRTYTHFARQPSTPEQAAHDLGVVAAAAERAIALVDWLGSKSEAVPRAEDELSANEFVSVVNARLQQVIHPGTIVNILRESEDVWFRANALRLEHVVLSLVLAASQGWKETAFEFSVERALVSAGQSLGLAAGPYVVLVIGCANAKDASAWNAERLSTTDHVSPLVQPLAELLHTMHGKLEFSRAEHGEGRIALHLPEVVRSPLTPRVRLALVPPSVQTVCIVEDESALRAAMLRTLATAGHLVLEANDSVSARELLIQHGQAVRLLVCDVGLLREGEEFFAWVQATCPHAAVLLISGDAPAGEAKASSLRARFLAKPFTPAALLAAVRLTLTQAEARARSVPAAPLVVLIVDDEEVVRESFQRLLGECEFETIVAKTAVHALQILAERRVDAVVTDQIMPGLDGIGLLELVYERYPECIRILCTGYPASDSVSEAVNSGRVQRVLPKTMHAVALRDQMERAILEGVSRVQLPWLEMSASR